MEDLDQYEESSDEERPGGGIGQGGNPDDDPPGDGDGLLSSASSSSSPLSFSPSSDPDCRDNPDDEDNCDDSDRDPPQPVMRDTANWPAEATNPENPRLRKPRSPIEVIAEAARNLVGGIFGLGQQRPSGTPETAYEAASLGSSPLDGRDRRLQGGCSSQSRSRPVDRPKPLNASRVWNSVGVPSRA